MKYLAILIPLFSSSVFACLETANKKIALRGKVVTNAYENTGGTVHYRALKLVSETCFLPDNEISDQEQKLELVQLIIPEGLSYIEVGGNYLLKGTALHAHTAHHHTKVLFHVYSATKL